MNYTKSTSSVKRQARKALFKSYPRYFTATALLAILLRGILDISADISALLSEYAKAEAQVLVSLSCDILAVTVFLPALFGYLRLCSQEDCGIWEILRPYSDRDIIKRVYRFCLSLVPGVLFSIVLPLTLASYTPELTGYINDAFPGVPYFHLLSRLYIIPWSLLCIFSVLTSGKCIFRILAFCRNGYCADAGGLNYKTNLFIRLVISYLPVTVISLFTLALPLVLYAVPSMVLSLFAIMEEEEEYDLDEIAAQDITAVYEPVKETI